jgi:hypothetical protein
VIEPEGHLAGFNRQDVRVDRVLRASEIGGQGRVDGVRGMPQVVLLDVGARTPGGTRVTLDARPVERIERIVVSRPPRRFTSPGLKTADISKERSRTLQRRSLPSTSLAKPHRRRPCCCSEAIWWRTISRCGKQTSLRGELHEQGVVDRCDRIYGTSQRRPQPAQVSLRDTCRRHAPPQSRGDRAALPCGCPRPGRAVPAARPLRAPQP